MRSMGTPRTWFFSCRKCVGITYQSTMGHRWDRSARRVEKLRARLQWGAHGTVPIKPRGMHERTYQRILGMLAHHEAIRNQGASYTRKYQTRSALCPSVATMPKQICGSWRVAASLSRSCKADMPKDAINVAIGCKADMTCCTASVRFLPKADIGYRSAEERIGATVNFC